MSEPARSTRVRWELVVPFAASLLLAVSGQYLFLQPGISPYITVALYAGAAVLFIWVLRQARVPRLASTDETLWQMLDMPYARATLISLAFVASFIAARASNQSPHPEPFTSSLWLFSLVAYCAGFVSWSRVEGWHWQGLRARLSALRPLLPEFAWLVVLVSCALLLRSLDLEHIPLSLGGDEAEMGLLARDFLSGQSNNPFATGFLGHPTMFFFLQSLFMHLFGATIFGLRVFSALLGSLAVVSSYLLVRELHNRFLASVTAILSATYAFEIHFSRLGLNNIADPLWASTILYLTIRGIKTQRRIYYLAAGLTLGFSQFFYIGVRLVPILLIIFLLYWWMQDHRAVKSQLGNLLIMIGLGGLVLLPLFVFYSQHPDQFGGRYNTTGIIPSGWLARTAQQTGQNPVVIVAQRTLNAWLIFNSTPSIDAFYGSKRPLLDPVSSILFVLGFVYALYRSRERSYFLFVMWLAVALFTGVALVLEENGSARVLTTTVPVMFFVAVGLTQIVEAVGKIFVLSRRWQTRLVALGMVTLALINLQFYFLDYTPNRLYGGEGAMRVTEIAHLFQSEVQPFKVYFVGAPYVYVGHGTIRYLAPDLDAMDVINPITTPPDFVDDSKRAVFIFHPARAQELGFVQQAYPEGKRTDYKAPDGLDLFVDYEVEHP